MLHVRWGISISLSSLLAICLLLSTVPSIRAETLEISNNGDGSTNQATTGDTNTTTVNQSNKADVSNTVSSDQNTGSNQTSKDTGGSTTTSTGNTSSNTDVTNNVNTSTVKTGCCSTPTPANSIVISGNGTASQNSASLSQNTSTSVNSSQNAILNNTINQGGSTGDNVASSNTGNSSISTGSVQAVAQINNSPINSSSISVGSLQTPTTISVIGNGSGSRNIVNESLNHSQTINQSNNLLLNNLLDLFGITGNNSTLRDTGNVVINTGGIWLTGAINNVVNSNITSLGCCNSCASPTPSSSASPTPSPVSTPTSGGGGGTTSNPPSSSGSSPGSSSTITTSSSPGSSGGGAGEVLGAMFPGTGSFGFFQMLLLLADLFLIGLFTRVNAEAIQNKFIVFSNLSIFKM